MFKNYIGMAFRSLKKHKVYTLINILGLAVGISAAILILLFIRFELNYDGFHKDKDSIYRVSIVSIREGKVEREIPLSTISRSRILKYMRKEFFRKSKLFIL